VDINGEDSDKTWFSSIGIVSEDFWELIGSIELGADAGDELICWRSMMINDILITGCTGVRFARNHA